MKIGSKYEETKSDLIRKLNENRINILIAVPRNHICYFCCDKIGNIVFILEENSVRDGIERTSRFFIDEICYRIASNQKAEYN